MALTAFQSANQEISQSREAWEKRLTERELEQAHATTSALAGVEGNQPKRAQGRGKRRRKELAPQRHQAHL